MKTPLKAIIIGPFWADKQHLSTRRTSRFVRWLQSIDAKIVIVCGGSSDAVIKQPWGVEISVRDPLGLRKDPGERKREAQKYYNPVVSFIADVVFNPDPGVLWAKRAAKHPAVLQHGAGADLVIASSPPPSALVGAARLAETLAARLIVDMRDGWLDEPLKPLLQSSGMQRFREGKLEKHILDSAARIFVTSDVWRGLLVERLKGIASKVTVLTNGYPDDFPLTAKETIPVGDKRRTRLLYTGRLSGSRSTQRPQYLLDPLWEGIKEAGTEGEIVIIGALTQQDREALERWHTPLQGAGWSLIMQPPVPREKIPGMLAGADGLLLLCASRAAIPSKVFEYIPARKPVFSVSEKESAIWNLGKELPQFFQYDLTQRTQTAIQCVRDFLNACENKDLDCLVPDKYTDEALSATFLRTIMK